MHKIYLDENKAWFSETFDWFFKTSFNIRSKISRYLYLPINLFTFRIRCRKSWTRRLPLNKATSTASPTILSTSWRKTLSRNYKRKGLSIVLHYQQFPKIKSDNPRFSPNWRWYIINLIRKLPKHVFQYHLYCGFLYTLNIHLVHLNDLCLWGKYIRIKKVWL